MKQQDPTLQEAGECLADMFAQLDDVGGTIHPWVLYHTIKLADLLGVPRSAIPVDGVRLDDLPKAP